MLKKGGGHLSWSSRSSLLGLAPVGGQWTQFQPIEPKRVPAEEAGGFPGVLFFTKERQMAGTSYRSLPLTCEGEYVM